jgi:hypothetical protein
MRNIFIVRWVYKPANITRGRLLDDIHQVLLKISVACAGMIVSSYRCYSNMGHFPIPHSAPVSLCYSDQMLPLLPTQFLDPSSDLIFFAGLDYILRSYSRC